MSYMTSDCQCSGVYASFSHFNKFFYARLPSDPDNCCGFTEAVIRLVISTVVGVATVAFLVYDIRSRRTEQDSREQT